ncbi:ABC transporter substrate-binding protein [Ornithinibacillus sp. 4-3]|uniref:ABC transporter substrate-binding protein n=1 Tax=Ornithinibacillus sp. 4-3 TaxID=3231488 RepID=A0AB39HL98_9BACI
MKLIKSILFMMFLILLTTIVGCSSDSTNKDTPNDSGDNQNEEEETQTGGVLKIAIDAAPPTLDQPTSTTTATRDASRLIFETLITTNSDFEAIPMLADSVDISDDGKTYTFNLRQGIKFHNGKEMIAEDVVASMERWLEKSTITGNVFNDSKWTIVDDYTVNLELQEPSSITLDTMASAKTAPAIMPKEIIDAAPEEGVDEYIGTGPFKLVEWKTDQYIHYEKFDDYSPVDFEADGLSGKKEALVDEIFIYIVPDTSTRLAGLQTGEYDFAYGVSYDSYDQLQEDPNLEPILAPSANAVIVFNKQKGIASDAAFRRAVNTALDAEKVMMGAFPNPDFFWLDAGYMDINIKRWASQAGSEFYNQADPEKAKQMLEEMGYNGEEFRLMATRDYDHHYNTAVVIHEQLQQIGINSKLEVYDWPTVTERNGDPDVWEAYITTFSTVSTPPQLLHVSPKAKGSIPEPYMDDRMLALETAPTEEEGFALWEEIQQFAWEEYVPVVQFGGFNSLYGVNKKVEGITINTGPIFWNVTVSEGAD